MSSTHGGLDLGRWKRRFFVHASPAAPGADASDGQTPSDSAGALSLLQAAVEIGARSRLLVGASMAAATASSQQRARLLDVVKMERHIREAATKNAEHSQETFEKTEAVAADTDRGSEAMEANARTLRETAAAVTASADLMREFVGRMAEVTRVVKTIHDIARQTNLLALNAAVEAAHAGKEGEGFNIIAQEIRQLADKTRDSTADIGEIVGRLSASAIAAETNMEQGRMAVQAGIEQGMQLQRSFAGIRDAMHAVKTLSREVSTASGRQIASVRELADAVQEVDRLAESATQQADTSAEVSMRLVSCTRDLYDGLAGAGVRGGATESRSMRAESLAMEEFLGRIERHRSGVANALGLLRALCARAGPIAIRDEIRIKGLPFPGLHFGETAAPDVTSWVDRVNAETQCVATLFVRACAVDRQGQPDQETPARFIRAATSVKRPDGERATGSELNPEGLAAQCLLAGKAYHGPIYILGKPFLGAYEPLFAGAGRGGRDVVGALYAGRAIG